MMSINKAKKISKFVIIIGIFIQFTIKISLPFVSECNIKFGLGYDVRAFAVALDKKSIIFSIKPCTYYHIKTKSPGCFSQSVEDSGEYNCSNTGIYQININDINSSAYYPLSAIKASEYSYNYLTGEYIEMINDDILYSMRKMDIECNLFTLNSYNIINKHKGDIRPIDTTDNLLIMPEVFYGIYKSFNSYNIIYSSGAYHYDKDNSTLSNVSIDNNSMIYGAQARNDRIYTLVNKMIKNNGKMNNTIEINVQNKEGISKMPINATYPNHFTFDVSMDENNIIIGADKSILIYNKVSEKEIILDGNIEFDDYVAKSFYVNNNSILICLGNPIKNEYYDNGHLRKEIYAKDYYRKINQNSDIEINKIILFNVVNREQKQIDIAATNVIYYNNDTILIMLNKNKYKKYIFYNITTESILSEYNISDENTMTYKTTDNEIYTYDINTRIVNKIEPNKIVPILKYDYENNNIQIY